MTTKNLLTLLFFLMVLAGCEYNLTKENFVEVDPPSESQLFNLSIIPAGDTIEIYERKEITLNVNTSGHRVIQTMVKFKDKTWEFYSNTRSFSFNPEDYSPGIDTLYLMMFLKSENGSIASETGMEGFYIEKKWIVIHDGRPVPRIKPTKSITKSGLLKIEWDRCDHYAFEAYEIGGHTATGIFHDTITNPDKNYFIDSLYVGGDYYIRVSCRLKNTHQWGSILQFNEEPPKPIIKEIGIDSLKISWNQSDYKAKYRLNWQNNKLMYFNSAEDTMCIVPQIGFGNWARFNLCTRSQYAEGWPDLSYSCDISSFNDYYMGHRLIGANWPEFGYNYVDKVLYSNEYDNMRCIDVDNYSVINSVNVERCGLYSCPTNSSKVATINQDYIYIFENQNMNNSVVIRHATWGAYSIDHFLLTNNDRVTFVRNKLYKLIDVNTQRTLDSLQIIDYPVYSKWACISTSQDAKHMCVATNNGIKIYNIESGKIREIFSDNRNYRSAYFNPLKPEQLYVSLTEQAGVEIRDPSNFELTDKIDVPADMVIRNIDPETNNLLLTDYDHVFVIDLNTHNTLLRLPCEESKTWLFHNQLLTNSGYVLDISEI